MDKYEGDNVLGGGGDDVIGKGGGGVGVLDEGGGGVVVLGQVDVGVVVLDQGGVGVVVLVGGEDDVLCGGGVGEASLSREWKSSGSESVEI